MPRKAPKPKSPQVSPELKGFDIRINEFGEIVSSFEVSRLNDFLDRNVEDKKFRGIDVQRRDEGATGAQEQPLAGAEDAPASEPGLNDPDLR